MAGGLRVGLEIHQQLETAKLFCRCRSELDERVVRIFERGLRLARGEMGDIDPAALLENDKGLRFRYQMTPQTCAVEADEEPPREANGEAVEVALTMALLLDARPVDEIHFMRKLVVDGSNTAGFQRTALVATGGRLKVGEREISIPTICLEEDAARKVGIEEGIVVYRLDRLGIPLIEIATGPDIDTPELAREAALAIGRLLRDTCKAKRGIGTVREDLNISVTGGARVEIKGVQELNSISDYVRREVARQERLVGIAGELRKRGAIVPEDPPLDVTDVLARTESKVIRGALSKNGRVSGIVLRGFSGLLKGIEQDPDRLGAELAQQARSVGLKGLFHTDELPGYGITQAETDALKKALGCGEGDAFVIVAAETDRALMALERVRARAIAAIAGVPEETRDPAVDCSTTYSRPLPGGSRMYPETDVPSIRVTVEMLERLRKSLPRTREQRIEGYRKKFPSLSNQMVAQMVDEGQQERFESIASVVDEDRLAPSILSTILYDPNAGTVDEPFEREVFRSLARGDFAKEAIAAIYAERAAHPAEGLQSIVERLGLSLASMDEVRKVVAQIVEENAGTILVRGAAASGPLMGEAMKRLRGRADGRLVSEALKNEIAKSLAHPGP
ncbi:MAG: Glu-tRNA(Gln) amidotransferase subunit GatE [Methanobacteriota archaeon]